MNLFRQFRSTAITAVLLLGAACGSATDITQTGSTDETGSLALTVGQAPPDARCLRIMLAGSTAAQRSTDLVSGQSSTLLFSGLPIGNVAVSAQAFALSCANVLAETPASWVTANPVSVLIRPAATTQVALELQRSGGIAISVSFVEPGDGGVSDGAVPPFPTDASPPPPFADSGAPKSDASPPPQPDASAADAFTPPSPVIDSGLPPSDAGVPSTDGGAPAAPGIQLALTSASTTSESGGKATFTVRLANAPNSNVVIDLITNDLTEGTVSPASLTFSPSNWAAFQTVTATGVDDSLFDGNQAYLIITNAAQSGDTQYNGLNALDVALSNIDNETAPIKNALLVVGALPLSAGDQAVVNRLSNNHALTVTSTLAASMTTASATGFALVVVSETVSSADVGTKLTTLTTPILNGEPAIQDELGMTGAALGTQQGTDATQTTLVITNAASPIAAGLSGTVAIAASASTFAWGQPAAQATVIAQASSGANKSSIYTYATGATMFNGTASGRRAMFPATGAAAAALNANGWALFDALTKWLVPSSLKGTGIACTIGNECLSGVCFDGRCQ